MLTDCRATCHPSCVEGFPNNCGLPAELASHGLPPSTPTPTTQDDEKATSTLDDSDSGQPFAAEDQILASTPIFTTPPFRGTGVMVKSEQLVFLK